MQVMALLLAAAAATSGVAVDQFGQIQRGALSVDTEGGVLRIGGRDQPLRDFYLVEDDAGRLLWAPDFDTRLRGYVYLAHDHMRREYLGLVRQALGVNDFALARRFLEKAEDCGLTGREVVGQKVRIARAEERARGRVEVRSHRLQAAAAPLESHVADLLTDRAEKALDGGVDGLRLLREALRRAPAHARALEVLKERAPPDFPVGDARVWLDWHLDLEMGGAVLVPDSQPALREARQKWRADLHGVRTGPLLMVTPVRDSAMIGRCLAYGLLACALLEAHFGTRPGDVALPPLPIFLFADRQEYITVSGTGRPVPVVEAAFLEWTAGHYSPDEGVSRFYWTADRDAERRLVGTFVHELAHHWIEERGPEVKDNPQRPLQPGFWIVEGFATFLEEGNYDVEAGTWDLFNPRSRSLDAVHATAAQGKGLLPWTSLFAMSQAQFQRLDPTPKREVVLRWHLHQSVLSDMRLYYEQAAAACHYLYHAEDGALRDRLLRYVADYYGGRRDRLGVKEAFGKTADELGEGIAAFTAAVAAGWQPRRDQ